MKAGYSIDRVSTGAVNVLGTAQQLLAVSFNSVGFNAVTDLNIRDAKDVSGSMAVHMSELKHHSCIFIDGLTDKDRISMFSFSGERMTKCIADNVVANEAGKKKVKEAINNLRTQSNTVFAEPLGYLLEHTNAGGRKVAILNTDGCAVPWGCSEAEEESAAELVASRLGDEGTPLYVICFGPHADWNFAQRLIVANKNLGFAYHVSFLSDLTTAYADIIGSVRNKSSEVVQFSVKADGKPVNAEGFRNGEKFLNVGSGLYTLAGLYGGKATVYVEVPSSAKEFEITGTLNGEKFTQKWKPESLSTDEQVEYLTGKATLAHASGKISDAVTLFQEAGDEESVTIIETSFTTNERRKAQTIFSSLSRHGRLPGAIGRSKTKTTVELMRILTGDPENQIVYNPKARGYHRTGEKVKDSNWKPIDGGVALLNKMVSHKSRMTLTLSGKRPGLSVPGNKPEDKPVSFTYVAGGPEGPYVNEPIISSYLTKRSFDKLVSLGYLASDEDYDDRRVYDFDIADLPFTNGKLNPTSTDLIGRMQLEAHQDIVQKALKDRWNFLKAEAISAGVWEGEDQDENEREIHPGKDRHTIKHSEWFLYEEVPAAKAGKTKQFKYQTEAAKLFTAGSIFEWDWELTGTHHAFVLNHNEEESGKLPKGVINIAGIKDAKEAEKLHKQIKRQREVTQLGTRIVKMSMENTGRAEALFTPVVNNRTTKTCSELKLQPKGENRTFAIARHVWSETISI